MSLDIVEQEGALRLRLNRPERRNAFTPDMVDRLEEGVRLAIADPACRCIVVEGAGDHFCAGRDLRAFSEEKPLAELRRDDDRWAGIFRRLDEADTPSVAIVRGYAFAGGFTLAMGCDFVLADHTARFQVSEMRHGFPAAINTPVLSNLVGPRLALELAILGETVAAERLHAMGLINRLEADADALRAAAEAFIATLIERDPGAVGETKRLHRATRDGGLSEALNAGSLINTQASLSGVFKTAGDKLAKKD